MTTLAIDAFSLVTLCAALVFITIWGLVGWEQRYAWRERARKHKRRVEVARRIADTWRKMHNRAHVQLEHQYQMTHNARTAASAWRDVALGWDSYWQERHEVRPN